jgi:D-sedoheptulose 7-phosphate isomerase
MINNIKESLREARNVLDDLISNDKTITQIELAAKTLIESFENGNRVFSCGNGGSMCDSMHFAEELTGRYRKNRKAYPAISISDPSHLTCVANDFGYDNVFSRYIEAHGSKGDTLIAISTSGKSPNVIKASEIAKSLGIKVVALTGKVNHGFENLSDVHICTPSGEYADRTQELHIKVLHILIEMVERHFHPENYNIEV